MVIKLSFSTKMGHWEAKIHSLNFNPQDGTEGSEAGGKMFSPRDILVVTVDKNDSEAS